MNRKCRSCMNCNSSYHEYPCRDCKYRSNLRDLYNRDPNKNIIIINGVEY